jgi:Fe-S-cluster containining protein
MDSAVRAGFLKRLRLLYAAMDAAYEEAAAAYRFACTGCEDSCCRTRFHHHTLVEYHGLRNGFERLPAAQQAEILDRAEAGCAEQARPGADARPLCPLNSGGRCVLYAHRPMICRLHGIPHELHRPGLPGQRNPGCGEFSRRCGHMAYHPFDRTPLYTELARLESEFQQALGVRRRFKHTIAEMLLNDRLAP